MGDRVRVRSLGNRLSVLIASVAVIKHPDQKQLGAQKGSMSQSISEGSPCRNLEARTKADTMLELLLACSHGLAWLPFLYSSGPPS